jgi:hypothetical protein
VISPQLSIPPSIGNEGIATWSKRNETDLLKYTTFETGFEEWYLGKIISNFLGSLTEPHFAVLYLKLVQ